MVDTWQGTPNKNEREQLENVGDGYVWVRNNIWEKLLDLISGSPSSPSPGVTPPLVETPSTGSPLDKILALFKGSSGVSVSPAQPAPRPGKGIDDPRLPYWMKDASDEDKEFFLKILDAAEKK